MDAPPGDNDDAIERGRAAFQRQAWLEAHGQFAIADRESALSAEDLDRAAIAAIVVGKNSESIDYWTRAHHEFLKQGELQRAVRCAFWLGLALMFQDEPARSSGWFARGRRLLDDAGLDCVERGYLLVPAALQTYWGGDTQGGYERMLEAARIGERFHEPDLIVLAQIGVGETSIHLGQGEKGVALQDEAMAWVTAGEVSPLVTGLAYCAVLACCRQIFDLRRAQEWTEAFARWCDSSPGIVPFRGECLVNRAAVMQMRGAWLRAIDETQRACERLSQPGSRSWAGDAYYQQAEIHRLRGEFELAEEAYRQTSHWGETPQPGLALLRLAQGRAEAALAAVSRELLEARDAVARARFLPAHVEIMLALNDVQAARASADELAGTAAGLGIDFLRALSAQTGGAVALAEGDAAGALAMLRNAWSVWQALEIPYEAARTRVLIADACRMLDDEDSAAFELDAARRVFEELGAAPDLARLQARIRSQAASAPAGLTERELEVLRLVAVGRTNRSIAEQLFLSEHTVRRHVQNIFAKLGISNRAAAAAFAFQHDLA